MFSISVIVIRCFEGDDFTVNANQAAWKDFVDGQLIHTGYLGDDAANRGDGLTFGIEDGERGVTIVLETVEGVGTDRGAFAGGEHQHFPSDGLTLQCMPSLDDDP